MGVARKGRRSSGWGNLQGSPALAKIVPHAPRFTCRYFDCWSRVLNSAPTVVVRRIPILSLAVVVAGCGSTEPAAIGSAYASGRQDRTILSVVQDALDSLPSGRPILLRPWSLFGQSVDQHAYQAEVFADDPAVVAVVGHSGSRDALIGAAVYNAAGVPQVVPTATSRQLAQMGPWTFMMVPDDSVEGDFLAAWAVDSAAATRVAVMYVGDEYGIGIRDGVTQGLEARGHAAVDAVLIPSGGCPLTGPADFVHAGIVRAALARSSPDAVILASGVASGWCVIREIHRADPTVWVIAADGVEIGARVPAGAEFEASRVRGVGIRIDESDSLVQAFVRRSRRVLGRPPTSGEALLYDAFLLLHHAIGEVGANRTAVRDYLASLGRGRDPWIGVTGPVYFNAPRAGLFRMDAPGQSVRMP